MATTSAALRLCLARIPTPLLSSLHRLSLPTSFLPPSPSPIPRRLFCASSPPLTPPLLPLRLDFKDEKSDFSDSEEAQGDEVGEEETEPINESLPKLPTPKLSLKEKKELASYAHSLGKKLKSQQVGKSGVTPSVATSFVETLEANELLKLKVHGSCPGELNDVIKQLEAATGSVAVSQIGRSVILYRPSLSKMKKKEPVSPRKPKESPAFKMQQRGQAPRVSDQGHHQLRRT